MEITISPDLADNVSGAFGAAGRSWLAGLPGLLAACAGRWSLRIGSPLPGLSYSYVAPAWRPDGAGVILKLGVPNPELTGEIAALECYGGQGAARLLAADAASGVLLLEWLQPGTPLLALADDAQATALACDVMRRLWHPVPAGGPVRALASWVAGLARLRQRYNGGSGPLPDGLVSRAEGLFRELLASAAPPALLHGDLHYGNILAAQREPWLAIDPKGLAGEPAYDAAVMLLNLPARPLSPAEVRQLYDRRAGQMAEQLGLDRQRLLRWALAHAVLSTWWTIEDHGPHWQADLGRAAAVQSLLS